MFKKNEFTELEITDVTAEGNGVGRADGIIIFVPNTAVGDRIRAKIVKVTKNYCYGIVDELLEKSPDRVQPDCEVYKTCGGCCFRHISYEAETALKEKIVRDAIERIGKVTTAEFEPILPCYPCEAYRNKAQYPIGINKQGEPVIGVFANRTHEVIPIDNCLIQNKKSEEIAKFIIEFIKEKNISIYDEKTGKGLVRHIVTKVGIKTGEIMCVIVINGHKIPNENELVENLKTRYPEIKAIVKNINMKNTNVILGQENINLYGNGYIEDILGEYKFKISPLSFYQVNPVQAEKLYNLGVSMAEITKNDVVFDLYCGIGTISLFMSKFAKKVYGIEIVEEAVKMAKENAQNNNVSNTEFFAGDVEIVLDDLINNKGLKADVVMFDPPRKGLDKKSIDNILNIRPKKIVYISCNPATLIRDLADFENEYDIKTIIPVDMFPFTSHVECVATLQLK